MGGNFSAETRRSGDPLLVAKGLVLVGLPAFISVLFVIAVRVDRIVTRVDTASATLLDCKGHGACLPAQLLATIGAVAKTAGTVTKAMPEITASAKLAASNSAEASKRTVAVMDDAHELMGQARGVVADLDAAVKELGPAIADLDASVKTLAADSDGTVKAATAALDQLTALEQQLQQEMAEGSPKVMATLDAMAKLANDPAIAAVMKNTQDATYHGAQVIETVDIATRGLRTKAGRVKWLIEHIISGVKATVPLPL